ncbi:MAG TPA: DinB family protein [Bryobacteraceae bacterium]|nr:DinB family protein [Bryobacteraceae bacterium]
MNYAFSAIRENEIPRAAAPLLQHVVDTYASEINKVYATWSQFSEAEMDYRPHAKSSTVRDIMKHELLSQRRFFAEFLSAPEPPASEVLTAAGYGERLVEMARPRLEFLADRQESWWLAPARFFDVERERIWIFWRRILHTAHHRTQLTVYLRLLDKTVPAVYGPTADVSWQGADPTLPPSAGAGTSPPAPGTRLPGGSRS